MTTKVCRRRESRASEIGRPAQIKTQQYLRLQPALLPHVRLFVLKSLRVNEVEHFVRRSCETNEMGLYSKRTLRIKAQKTDVGLRCSIDRK